MAGKVCDSASGYVCSKRCRTNDDCTNAKAWDGNYCRGDGRCSPKVFETVWEVTSEEPTVVLPFDIKYLGAACDFQILWGDDPVGTDITKRTNRVVPRAIDTNAVNCASVDIVKALNSPIDLTCDVELATAIIVTGKGEKG